MRLLQNQVMSFAVAAPRRHAVDPSENHTVPERWF